MVVYEAGCNAGFGCDGCDGGAGVAVLSEDSSESAEQFPAAFFAIAGPSHTLVG